MTKQHLTLELDEETVRCLTLLGQPTDVLTSLAHSSADGLRRAVSPPRDPDGRGSQPAWGGSKAAIEAAGQTLAGPSTTPSVERRRYRDRSAAVERETATLIFDQREANAMMVSFTVRAQELTAQAEAARERAEAATDKLRESEERYRALFELSPVAVYSCDIHGVIQNYNRYSVDLWGRAPGPGDTGKSFFGSLRLFRPDGSRLPTEDCPLVDGESVDGVSTRTASAKDAELIIEQPDGSRVNVVVNSHALMDRDGNYAGTIRCVFDITTRKQTEVVLAESLMQASELAELRELFIGILGHDLRNPLAAIGMGAHLLLHRGQLDEQDRGTATRILSACRRMTGMIKQVLDTTSARLGGGLSIAPEPTDLREVCQTIVDEFSADIRLEAEGDLTGCWDQERIAEALSNLAGNAIEHATPGTAVIVKARAEAAHVMISIENRGDAIPVDVRPHIFDAFRRGQQDGKSKSGNLGLGLFISRQIVLAHEGTLDAHSAEGTTTFSMRLPRKVTVDAQPPATAPSAKAPRAGLSIAIVGGSDDLRATFRKVLERSGHDVMEARDGAGGLALVIAEQPNVAIVDIGLPGMSGYELARQIRASLGTSVRLIAMTAQPGGSDLHEAQSAGFDTLMPNPVDLERLQEVLDSIPNGVDADLSARTPSTPQ